MLYERNKKAESPLETRFLEDCATSGLLVEPQFRVGPIRADFRIVGTDVVIEVDGAEFHRGNETEDRKRDRIYAENGYAVVRVKGADVFRGGEELVDLIKLWSLQGRFLPGNLYIAYSNYEDDVLSVDIASMTI